MASECPVAGGGAAGDETKEGTGGCPVQHDQREEKLTDDVNPYNLVGK